MFENEFTWFLYNVVIYDGVDSKVLKVVLKTEFCEEGGYEFKDIEYLKSFVHAYFEEAEVCKVDQLYELSLDNILAFREVPKFAEVYDYFITMYFPCR